MVSNADTDSFILALRRFIGRRGPVRTIRSDNGGNFVGACNEFEKAYKEMDHNRIRKFLLIKQCDLMIGIETHRNLAIKVEYGRGRFVQPKMSSTTSLRNTQHN